MARKQAESRGPWLVLMVGVLTTVATSAPVDPAIAAEARITVAPAVPAHVVVRASRAAVRHATVAEISWWPASGVEVTLDGEAPVDVSPLVLTDLSDRCPGEGDCDIGFDVTLLDGEATTISLLARLSTPADARFLFPEDRSFPSDATVEVRVE